jgi:hypothetical protein
MGKGKGAEVVAELIAGLMQEEEMGETDDVQKALDEKMQVLIEKAEEFQDIELNDPESNHELQEMFKNVDKFKSLKRREEQLNKNIEDLEINLKEQETREELNKLPMDETTKKIRDQLKISYDQQHQQSQEQDNPQEDDDPESEDQNHSEEES